MWTSILFVCYFVFLVLFYFLSSFFLINWPFALRMQRRLPCIIVHWSILFAKTHFTDSQNKITFCVFYFINWNNLQRLLVSTNIFRIKVIKINLIINLIHLFSFSKSIAVPIADYRYMSVFSYSTMVNHNKEKCNLMKYLLPKSAHYRHLDIACLIKSLQITLNYNWQQHNKHSIHINVISNWIIKFWKQILKTVNF